MSADTTTTVEQSAPTPECTTGVVVMIDGVEHCQPIGGMTPDDLCQEDDLCWDCATMGNGVCGTTTVPYEPIPTFAPDVIDVVVQAYPTTTVVAEPRQLPSTGVDGPLVESGIAVTLIVLGIALVRAARREVRR